LARKPCSTNDRSGVRSNQLCGGQASQSGLPGGIYCCFHFHKQIGQLGHPGLWVALFQELQPAQMMGIAQPVQNGIIEIGLPAIMNSTPFRSARSRSHPSLVARAGYASHSRLAMPCSLNATIPACLPLVLRFHQNAPLLPSRSDAS